ncbi:MAG: hypothetical protein E6I31_11620 [Chloroflexi bacterium]|nr:MAG: hypothetical protein E6I46_01575 [Chloroflexota bacterium]TMF20616.1 MAG: hypothetical protein E6I31_11620 [Chloroflexota bacterium]
MPSPLSSDRRRPWVPVAITILVVLLIVGVLGHHPQLLRQEALDAALTKQAQQTARHAAKLVRESDLERAASRSGENIGQDTSPDHFIWVIAVSGDYAIRGEYMGGPLATWTILVVNDQRPAQLSATWGGGQGNWPPFFDGLNDLS